MAKISIRLCISVPEFFFLSFYFLSVQTLMHVAFCGISSGSSLFVKVPENFCSIFQYLSHDVASGSDITQCIKIDKPLVFNIFSNLML